MGGGSRPGERDHRGSTELKECILEGQVQPLLQDFIQALPFSATYCVIFLSGPVMRECFKANLWAKQGLLAGGPRGEVPFF